MKKGVLILSVGTGTRPDADITRPLSFSIETSKPDLVIFLVTQKSKENALRIVRQCGLADWQFRVIELCSEDDADRIFEQVSGEILKLFRENIGPSSICADYTSGTKAMSVGLAIAAVRHECGALRYVSGERDQGVVVSGKERIITIRPNSILAANRLRLAETLIFECQFGGALRVLSGIEVTLLPELEKARYEVLRDLAEGYWCWDRLQYYESKRILGRASHHSEAPPKLRASNELLKGIDRLREDQKERRITAYLIADVYNNSLRRAREQSYDDALARLYRATEMLAQYILSNEYKIKTNDVNIQGLPPQIRQKWENHRDSRTGKIKLGMRLSFELLQDLNHSLGKEFFDDSAFQKTLEKRNQSVYAHGLGPISEEDYSALRERTYDFLLRHVRGFGDAQRLLRFPWKPEEAAK